ncbi:hypothetical protein ACW9HJ_01205 [Nocardia gipuzkoensis]
MSTAAAVSAFVQIITIPAVTRAQFETVNAGMGSEPIGGILLSAAGFVAGNLVTLDVWDSRAVAEYDRVDSVVGAAPVTGQFVHLAGVSAGSLYIIDLWDSHEAADRFLTERLYPAFERAGVIPDPDVTMVEFDAQLSPPVSSE